VAKQAGNLPADIERAMQELLEPVLPWKNILKRFMTEKCNDDFSWKRGNRRFIAQGLYLPSRTSDDAMGAMVVTIDTSGSIGEKELTEFGSEIAEIHKEVKPKELIVIYCDARVNHVDRFGPEDELHFKLHGGGGTDFRPPFEWLEENQIQPRAFAYLTDGYGPFPEQEPDFPNIWCINNHDVTPPYGEHIILEV
jgi:predicted metal-dependent peptidase